MHNLFSARKPDLIFINKEKKRTFNLVDFTVLGEHKVKIKESEKIDKYLDFARGPKVTEEHAGDGDNNCSWNALNNSKRLGKKDKSKEELRSSRPLCA